MICVQGSRPKKPSLGFQSPFVNVALDLEVACGVLVLTPTSRLLSPSPRRPPPHSRSAAWPSSSPSLETLVLRQNWALLSRLNPVPGQCSKPLQRPHQVAVDGTVKGLGFFTSHTWTDVIPSLSGAAAV